MFGQPQFDIGDLVQLVRGGQVYQVVWRGQQLVPLRSGTVARVDVYRLNNGFWDCYYGEQLTVAWRFGPV